MKRKDPFLADPTDLRITPAQPPPYAASQATRRTYAKPQLQKLHTGGTDGKTTPNTNELSISFGPS